MKNLLFTTIFLLLSPNLCIFAQHGAYIVIENDEYVPTVQRNAEGILRLHCNNKAFNMFLQQFDFADFTHPFAEAKSNWLQKVYCVEMKSETKIDDFVNQISRKFATQVSHVEKIGKTILCENAFYPNDSLYVAGELSHLDYVRAPEAWYIAKDYGKVKVGIVDWYFHRQHPDLVFDSIMPGNICDNDHGTVVSGFVAGINNNQIGIASTGGYNANVIAYHIITNRANEQVYELAQLGCKIVNCSWYSLAGYSPINDTLYHEILHELDCLVIGAAGNMNQGSSPSEIFYPASYSSCLSVTSIGHKYNYGSGGYHNWKDVHCLDVNDTTTANHHNTAVDLCAPGYEVRSTNYWKGVAGYNDTTKSGTSYSAPIVTGIAAMVRAVNPYLTAVETMNILKETADASIYNIPENAPFIGRLGAGKVDAYAAVMAAKYKYVQNIAYSSGTNEVLNFYEIYAGYAVTDNKPYGNVVLQPGSNVTFRAKDKIELHPGFCVQQGATFVAQVDSLMLP